MFLTHDHLIHSGHQVGYERTLFLYALIQFLNVNVFTHKIYKYQLVKCMPHISVFLRHRPNIGHIARRYELN